MPRPDCIRIPYEDYEDGRFCNVGRLDDGTQFMAFVTGAFPGPVGSYPAPSSDLRYLKHWLGVVHLFDEEGNHLRTDARLGGFDIEGRSLASYKAWTELNQIAAELGFEYAQLCDIYVKLFLVEIDGIQHGLVYEHYNDGENGEESEWVIMWPRDIMFHPPWDSGSYST